MIAPWIETLSGKRFDLLAPDADAVDLTDLSHSLAHLSRFTGHTARSYSVGEHCLWVWKLIELEYPEDYLLQLLGQFHDGHEAYTGDVSGPLKAALRLLESRSRATGDPRFTPKPVTSSLDAINARVQRAVLQHFGLTAPTPWQDTVIKGADMRMLSTEHLCPALMPNAGVHEWEADATAPVTGLLDGSIVLEPEKMVSGTPHKLPRTVRFPARVALQTPPTERPTYSSPALPIFEDDVAFLFKQNAMRLLSLFSQQRSSFAMQSRP